MLGALLKEAAGILERRFLLNAFLPSLAFTSALLALVLGTQTSLSAAADKWSDQDSALKVVEVVAFVAWVYLLSGLIASQWGNIIRLYEGYWPGPLRFAARLGTSWHKRKLGKLDPADAAGYERIYLVYPFPGDESRVAPTTLGNVLRNAELYPAYRYGTDAVLMWPRLYNLLPDRLVQLVAEARSSLEFLLVISALSGAFALAAGVYLVAVAASWWLFLACFWGGSALALIAYRASIPSAFGYAEQLKTAFDLYRNELLKQLRIPLPSTAAEERARWTEANLLVYRNMPVTEYVEPAAEDAGEKEPATGS